MSRPIRPRHAAPRNERRTTKTAVRKPAESRTTTQPAENRDFFSNLLEDLYLPFKPKRRTKAMIARERGLEPLAEAILADRRTPPETLAAAYLSGEVPDAKEALAGARDILTEQLGENAALLGRLRAFVQREGVMSARLFKPQEEKGAKFSDYFAHSERWSGVPGHRAEPGQPGTVTNGRSAFDASRSGAGGLKGREPSGIRSAPRMGGRPGGAIYFAAAIRAAR